MYQPKDSGEKNHIYTMMESDQQTASKFSTWNQGGWYLVQDATSENTKRPEKKRISSGKQSNTVPGALTTGGP